ncbi:cytochrome P450, partial [Mycena crocata]
IGSNGFFSYYAGAYQVFNHAGDIVRKGYSENPDGVYRIPRFWRWSYVANGTKRIAEVAAAPDDVLSFEEGAGDILQADYTLGPNFMRNSYHHHTIRTTLTRNIARCLPEIQDEIVASFNDLLPLENSDWMAFKVLPSVIRVVARSSNRVFVGLPLCENQEFLNVSIAYAGAILKRGQLISLFPPFLRPIIGPLVSPKRKALKGGMKFLGPLIESRLAKEAEFGHDWPDKPNDFLSWLLEDAEGAEREPSALALRVLGTNIAATHTTSMALTNVIFDLTTYPSHIEPMRKEAEEMIRNNGWTKAALNNMHKIDSFIRESQRVNGSSPISMARKVVAKEGFVFSDGTVIPYGSFLNVSGRFVQHDSANYDHPEVFDGFRFSCLREKQAHEHDEGIFRRHLISTGPDHLPFGHGKHACPGRRFFAATGLKTMVAHLLLNYDIKADDEGVRPPDHSFGLVRTPNPTAKIWIRKRQ